MKNNPTIKIVFNTDDHAYRCSNCPSQPRLFIAAIPPNYTEDANPLTDAKILLFCRPCVSGILRGQDTVATKVFDSLARLPLTVSFQYLGPNPADGGFSCLLYVGKLPWWKGGGPENIIEGWDEESPVDAALDALRQMYTVLGMRP